MATDFDRKTVCRLLPAGDPVRVPLQKRLIFNLLHGG